MLPLGVSMLWETSIDPSTALRERFGFEGVDDVEAWVSVSLAEHWQIAVARCTRIVVSDHNAIVWAETDQGPVVVKWSYGEFRFPALDASTSLLRALGEQGVPVAVPISLVGGHERVVIDAPAGALSVTVLPVLTGQWLDTADDIAVRSAGASLALVHRALSDLGSDAWPSPHGEVHVKKRIENWLSDRDRGFAPDASRRLGESLADLPELDESVQLVHNDFRAANILTENSRVVGILDFDEVRTDPAVLDLAKASVYLGTRFTEWRPIPASVRRSFRAGYEQVRPLSSAAAQWFDVLVLWHSLAAVSDENDSAGWVSEL
ncbi:phosphotransferase enzyme family protein [Rhodococcoides fascians]|uniref:phosphotransferase enzyme family protein n=1 Tax=Rhodococcoides fascians TaxID=1828 RepID=UPI00050BF64B|nr:phosphotransferase [Rhodococcus fascians]